VLNISELCINIADENYYKASKHIFSITQFGSHTYLDENEHLKEQFFYEFVEFLAMMSKDTYFCKIKQSALNLTVKMSFS